MTNIVQIKNLSISKHKMKILNNVNFNVPIGRVCAVLGPNGAGKTTTIKSIMGLIPNYNGEILINEINAKKVISRESVGYIPERDTLPNMTMKKFLYMCASFTKMNHDVIENKILYWTKIFNIHKHFNHNLHNLSSGQRKKIMIIQSLIHEPKLIIADEPTENLDPITRETFYQVIRHLSQNGVSILISTHNLDEIQRHIDYLIIIFDGKTKYVGDAKTKDLFAIYSSYQKPVKL